ncbi:MAG: amino acid permease [Legionellales bacterium]|nr:amino acid permease [Legionellales bacterium]
MKTLKRQLTLKDGIFLSIGSIMGSGILFLPSLIYATAGSNILYVWLITTLLCLPLLYIFIDMVKSVPDCSGVQGFISIGLGENIGATVPVLFLGSVSLGMPASALIVGDYVKSFFHIGYGIQYITAMMIVFLGIISNLRGIRANSHIQMFISLALLATAIAIFTLTFQEGDITRNVFAFPTQISVLLPGMVVAFWAYSGFENLTFMAGEFKNPQKDFKWSMVIALIVCGLLYMLLSWSYANVAQTEAVNPMIGLYQLAEASGKGIFLTFIVTLFAFLSVQINFNSWIWGISRLIFSSAKQNILPSYFSELNDKFIPYRAILLLGCIFFSSIFLFMLFPDFLKLAIYMVSTNFIFIYFICVLSYFKYKKNIQSKIFALTIILALGFALVSSGWMAVYPLVLFLLGYVGYKKCSKRQASLF